MQVSHHLISLSLKGFVWISCMSSSIHKYNNNSWKMGDICRQRNSLLLLLWCLYVTGGLLPVVGQRTPLLSRQHLVTGQTRRVSRCVLMHCNQKLGFLLCWDFSTFSSFLLILFLLGKRPITFLSLALLGCELKVTLIHKRPLCF